VVPAGILASTVARSNYRRIWARDSLICGLAGVVSRDSKLIDGLGASLRSLATQVGRGGLLPSNVSAEGEGEPSFGGLAGRVDAGAWFIIGASHFLQARPDDESRPLLLATIEGCLQLYEAWELNQRGLVNVPMGGCWADEYPVHGYTLTEQCLRVWALRLAARTLDRPALAAQAGDIQKMVEASFWIDESKDGSQSYHPRAYARAKEQGAPRHWMAALSPGGYQDCFDALANGLAVLLGFGSNAIRDQVLDFGQSVARDRALPLVPAFWPPIAPGDGQWNALQALCVHGFRNEVGEYHNGGLWPMVNGFWGAALCRSGRQEQAAALLEAVSEANLASANHSPHCFYEFHSASTGLPGGTPMCTWSAAGELLLAAALDGRELDIGITERGKHDGR
jgi:glycogen debranching enzyme